MISVRPSVPSSRGIWMAGYPGHVRRFPDRHSAIAYARSLGGRFYIYDIDGTYSLVQ